MEAVAGRGRTVRELRALARRTLAAAGVEEYRHEAELLAQYALETDAAGMLARLAERADRRSEVRLLEALERRAAREPLAYITGRRWFYGREFAVTPHVLIPRPETELLVELAVRWASGRGSLRIADVGAGSGALAVTLAAEIAGSTVDAVDLSARALDVARCNALRTGVEGRVRFFEGDLAAPLPGSRYQVIAANLPYVRADTLAAAAPELRREPELALLGGDDGLDVIRRFAPMLPGIMDPAGSIALLEVDPLTCAGAVAAVSEAVPGAAVRVENDLAGLERCVVAELG